MRQVWVTRVGPPEVLMVREDADPAPSSGQIRVRVHAAGVNFSDVLIRLGVYPGAPQLPAVIGYEVSGVVDAVGRDVDEFVEGDRVIALCRFGGYADTILLPKEHAFLLPREMSFSQGAALVVNYLTAYEILCAMGRVHDGDCVLIHSAGGGVGIAAIQLCHIAKARVIAVASSAKHARLRDYGVQMVVDYQQDNFESEIRRVTEGKGVDLILDPIGGPSWLRSYSLLALTGRLCVFGNAGIVTGKGDDMKASLVPGAQFIPPRFDAMTLIAANKGIFGVHLGRLWDRLDLIRIWMGKILMWYESGQIHPQLDHSFPLEEAPLAHHYIQDRKNIGKIILTCRP